MEQEQNELDWLLDSMIEYLKSPMWTTEICDFIDQNCVFFAGELHDENSLELTQIHNQFTKLIDEKLDTFCAEFGISYEVFVQACSKISNKLHKKCIDQIISVDNFLMFKRMMILRNTKLNQQALLQLQTKGDAVPKACEIKANYDAEEAELEQALAESKALMAQQEAFEKSNTQQLEKQKKLEEELKAKRKEKEEVMKKEQEFPDLFARPVNT
mmetsp:Transcript_13369/g.22755  ORF Transcript_13369/g.22755 Transcript_13369/m.22755 type:complete len:214 (+) Transcript_13369:29-670(+)